MPILMNKGLTPPLKDRHQESIKVFYEAGGKIAMRTDAGTPIISTAPTQENYGS